MKRLLLFLIAFFLVCTPVLGDGWDTSRYADIKGGTIDGTVIGGDTPAAARFTAITVGAGIPTDAGGGIVFYMDDSSLIATGTNNDIEVHELRDLPIATTEDQDDISCTLATSPVIGEAYLYNTALGSTSIEGGEWRIHTYAAVDSTIGGRVSSITRVFFHVVVDAGTVETTGSGTSRTATVSGTTPFVAGDADAANVDAGYLQTPQGLYQITNHTSSSIVTIKTPTLYSNESGVGFSTWKNKFSTTTGTIVGTDPDFILYDAKTVQAAITIVATDKLGEIVFGVCNKTTTVSWTHNGTDRYSNFHTPIIIRHNDLPGLDVGDYQHLTAAEHGVVAVSSLTGGGVLLGNATGNIVAMAVLTDGQMIVGDGSADPVAESGTTLRTSIGVGTGDSPQFTGVEVGHADDTTLTKASSGDLNVEGNIIYRAGGTDVPVTDGGTGVGSFTEGGILLGGGTGAITVLGVAANGQIPIGDGTSGPQLATLTAGDGIDITNAAASITIDTDLKANGGLVIEGTELAVDLGAASITGTLAAGDMVTALDSAQGASELATDGETITGTATDRVVTPANITAMNAGKDIDRGGFYDTDLQNITDLAAGPQAFWFKGVDGSIIVAQNDNIDMGSNDFSIVVALRSHGTDIGSQRIFDNLDATHGYRLGTNASGFIEFVVDDNVGDVAFTNNTSINDSINHVIVVVADRSANATISLDGNIVASNSLSTVTASIDSNTDLFIGIDAPGGAVVPFGGQMSRVLLFNLALPITEARALYSGAPVPFMYNGDGGSTASQTELMTTAVDRDFSAANDWTNAGYVAYSDDGGSLDLTADSIGDYAFLTVANLGTDFVKDKAYRLTYTYSETEGGFEFKLDGSATQTLGDAVVGTGKTIEFTADESFSGADELWIVAKTADNAQGAFDDLSIVRIGAVGMWEQSGIMHNLWVDSSKNEMHGAISAPSVGPLAINLDVNHQEKYIQKSITGDTLWTNIVPAGYMLKYMLFEETAGNEATLDLGTSDGANDVFINETIAASSFTTIVINKFFSESSAQTLDLNDDDGASSWNSGSVDVNFFMERVTME